MLKYDLNEHIIGAEGERNPEVIKSINKSRGGIGL